MTSHPGYPTLLKRYPLNPILRPEQWPYPIHSAFNPGATRLADGTTLLLCRVEDRRGFSHLSAARSRNGIDGWVIDEEPTLVGDPADACWGVEDPRITFVPELDKFAIAYTAFTRGGPAVELALTQDFRQFERLGLIMQPDDKDAALVPRRMNGRFALIHRPLSDNGSHIWISYSPDLLNWGSHQLVLNARKGAWWDANKVGLSPPLIETSSGWLMLYHGVRQTAAGCLYRVGAALLAIDDPSRCLVRGSTWIFGPEAPYELHGDVGNVVFPCGYTLGDDGDELRVYYGAADSCIGVAFGSIRTILDWLWEDGQSNSRSSPPGPLRLTANKKTEGETPRVQTAQSQLTERGTLAGTSLRKA
jgi:predicted GH43/DUF377 family glycosyl hydrolase